MRSFLPSALLAALLVAQLFVLARWGRKPSPESGNLLRHVARSLPEVRPPTRESRLEGPESGACQEIKPAEVVREFIRLARERHASASSHWDAETLAKAILRDPEVFRQEVGRIAGRPSAYSREEAATALINALSIAERTGPCAGVLPSPSELIRCLRCQCAEERGTWAFAAGFSDDSAVRSEVLKVANFDMDEFAKAAALQACASSLREFPEAQEALLRAARENGKRYQATAVAGLQDAKILGAVSAIADAARSSDEFVRTAGLSTLAARSRWDSSALAEVGSVINSGLQTSTAKLFWKYLSNAGAIPKLSPADRETLQELARR